MNEQSQSGPPSQSTPAAQSSEKPKLRLEWIDPATLGDNPRNWRTHPPEQMNALDSMLADPEVGWAGVLLFNERTGLLIDGHARKKAAIARGDKAVPVVVGSWSQEAEKKILLTLDPLAGLAVADPDQLTALMSEVNLEDVFGPVSAHLDKLMEELPKEKKTRKKKGGGIGAGGGGDDEQEQWAVIVTCRDEADQALFLERMQHEDRQCRALVG